MPRIPTYSTRQSPQTDSGGLPTVRAGNAMMHALKQLGRSIGGLTRPGNDQELMQRAQERQEKRLAFDRIRTTHDAIAKLETELVQRRNRLDDDGDGFYQAFVEEALMPAVEAAAANRPMAEKDVFRAGLLRQAEPLLEAAALIEREQSMHFYLAETDRISDRIVGELDLENYERVKSDLDTLLDASPIPATAKRAKARDLDRKLARQVYGLMLATNPAALTRGALGWSKGQGKTQSSDTRFQALSASERRNMFERAVAELKEP